MVLFIFNIPPLSLQRNKSLPLCRRTNRILKMDARFIGLIESSIRENWERDALSDHGGRTYTYSEMAGEIASLHAYLDRLGIRKGDKVALIGRNSSRWAISFFGILTYGGVVVPILHDFKPDSIHHIVNHSGSRLLFVAGHIWEKLSVEEMPLVESFVSLEGAVWSALHSRVEVTPLPDPAALEPLTPDAISYHVEQPDELAVLNYTSGTTGFSKGVMIPYRSLWSNTEFAASCLPFVHAGDNLVSMLPMAHMYGLAFEILNGINKGCHIHFLPRIPNPKSVIECLQRCRPTLIIAVPLIIEKIIRKNVFPLLQKPPMSILYRLPFISRLIKRSILSKLNAAFGDAFVELVIGGASINKEIETFLRQIGFRYTVGYGMTECGPLIAYEQWDTFKQGSVGRIVARMEARIDSVDPVHEAGEILVRGMNTMLGYYKNPVATAEVMLEDGWLRTGDLGVIDADGFLYIRGRSKTMILGSNGQNIYPEEIESLLNEYPYVLESLVVMRNKRMIALIVPDVEAMRRDNIADDELRSVMRESLLRLNMQLPVYSQVQSFELRDDVFEKTPKLSIKRYLYH